MLEETNAAPAPATDSAQPSATPAPEAKSQETPHSQDSAAIRDERASEEADRNSLREELGKIFDKAKRSKETPEKGPDGKFVGKTKEEAPAPNEPVKTDQKPVEAKQPEAPETPRPKRWSADKEEVWKSLPPDARSYVAEREAEAENVIGQLGRFAKNMEGTARLLDEFKDTFASRNIPFEKGLRELLEAQAKLDRNPAEAISHLAKVYGVDLQQKAQDDVFGPDPEVQSLKAEITSLKSTIEKLSGTVSAREQAEQQSRLGEMERIALEFSKDKADFKDLEADIVAIYPRIRAEYPNASPNELLAKAYEAAQWANPKTRAQAMEKLKKDDEAKRLEAAKTAAENAKRANAINIESTPTPNQAASLQDELSRIWDKRNAA